MKMSKQTSLTVVFVAALSVGLPSVSHANSYLINVDSGGNFISPVGTVGITSDGTPLTYQFNLTSGNLSAVYMDVSGSVSALSTDGSWSADQGASTTALGSFTDTLICNSGCGPELTAIFSSTNLVANYTLLNGDIVGFSAANTSNGFFADNTAPSAVPLPAALPLFATGLGALGLLGWRRKRKAAA